MQKLTWLQRHPELWDKPELEIKAAMVTAKLCSRSTYVKDLHLGMLLDQAKHGRITKVAKPRRLVPIIPHGYRWNKLALELAQNFCLPIDACSVCKYPKMEGHRCQHCGNEKP
jgi:hypothetical protein